MLLLLLPLIWFCQGNVINDTEIAVSGIVYTIHTIEIIAPTSHDHLLVRKCTVAECKESFSTTVADLYLGRNEMEEDGEPHAPITICYTNKCIASLDT
jgi:hypothetical protein